MLAKLFDLIDRADTIVVDDQVIDTVGFCFCDNFMADQLGMLARLSIDDTDYHFADQEVDLDNGCAMAVAQVWATDGAEEVKVSMAFKVEVMLELENPDSLIDALRGLAERQHSMLRDLHNSWGWDELCATMEEITDEARELGIEVEP